MNKFQHFEEVVYLRFTHR